MSKTWDLNKMEEVLGSKKYRALWLKEGDKNTKFFTIWLMSRGLIMCKNSKGGGFVERP